MITDLEIKRSLFRAYLWRVTDEQSARDHIAALRRTHHDARHHCSAFILGADRDVRRSSDDGEPAGTAGIPMLEALALRRTRLDEGPELCDLTDVVAVVVRWFGGIKLGAGGLVRAYSDAVSAALDQATLVSRERLRILGLSLDHADAARIEAQLRDGGMVVHDISYGRRVDLQLAVRDTAEAIAAAQTQIAAVTGGAPVSVEHTDWIDVP